MQLKHSYYWFDSIISPEICQKIINLGLSKIDNLKKEGKSALGLTAGNNQKGAKPNALPLGEKTFQGIKKEGISDTEVYVRDSEIAWLTDQWLYDLIIPIVQEANIKAGWNFQFDFSESFQFTIYHPGGFYGWHADGNSDHLGKYKRYIPGVSPTTPDGKMLKGYTDNPNMVNKVRKISMTINLNAPGEYDGGNLKFDFGPHASGKRFHECEEIRPQGSIILFPSFVYHQVTPVTRGTRYSLVLWSLGWPFQ